MDPQPDIVDAVMTVLALSLCAYLVGQNRQVREDKTRLINKERKTYGFYYAYFLKMKVHDPREFFKYTRMSVNLFNNLLTLTKPLLLKRSLPDSVLPEERLALTLHYLSQGCSMQNIAWTYQLGLTTVHQIIIETTKAIWTVLNEKYLKAPNSEDEWKHISQSFEKLWNFPNCIGAIDGKHVTIQAPANSGSLFYNYKKNFSIVLLASCDANYVFNLIDVGAYGSSSDGGIFKESTFGKLLDHGLFNIPNPSPLPHTNVVFPYCFVADEAFPLKSYIMRPYPGKSVDRSQRIFNYRLSRARRVIENSFGILANRWRLLRTTIIAKVDNIDHFVKACVVLHNYIMVENLKNKNDNLYCPPGFTDTDSHKGGWREEIEPLRSVGRMGSNRSSKNMYELRDKLKDYFVTPEGQVPWQNNVVDLGYNIN